MNTKEVTLEGEEDENYLYDFSDTTRDYDGNWILKKEYFRGASIDEIIFEKTSDGEIRYYYTDALGSTRQLCDDDGNILQKFKYDAWGTMQDINPELWSEKGLVKNSDREVIPDLSPDGAVFDVTITDSNENDYFFEIIVGNTGEESSILEYVVFTSTDPSGVDINNRKVELKSGETHTKIIHIDTDGLKPGTSSFNVIVNSNGQTGAKYKTYKIIVHKEYDSYYQDFNFSQSKPTVLQKSQFLTRYTYTGREYNRETGQYYYRARTYASGLGRFTGKDPYPFIFPYYNYANNNSINNVDPSGRGFRPPAYFRSKVANLKDLKAAGEYLWSPTKRTITTAWNLLKFGDLDFVCYDTAWYKVGAGCTLYEPGSEGRDSCTKLNDNDVDEANLPECEASKNNDGNADGAGAGPTPGGK